MPSKYHPPVAKEKIPLLIIVGTPSAVCFLNGWYIPSVMIGLVFLLLFILNRDPIRKIPSSPLAIVSVADGEVFDIIEKDYDPLLRREAVSIHISMGLWGVYSLRNPMEGKVKDQVYLPKEGISDQIGYISWVQSDEGDDVSWMLTQRAGRLRGSELQPGERIGQGQRCGFVDWGRASVSIYLPIGSRIQVSKHQRVLAGKDTLAQLVHRQVPANQDAQAQRDNLANT